MNVNKLRQDFPLLEGDKAPIYFDNACMTLRPNIVVDAVKRYYDEFPGCAGRSYHHIAQQVTDAVDRSRRCLQKFIGAKSQKELIFTRNATESINIVANSFHFKKGDTILSTDKEHNSNLLPWIRLKKSGMGLIQVSSNEDNSFDLDAYTEKFKKPIRLVSMVHTSNLDGTTTPMKEIVKIAHENDALVMVDAAQSLPHIPINVKKLNIDFMACSAHKMLGPSGMGLLYGKTEKLEELDPFLLGGDTVSNTTYENYDLEEIPSKFEAGLQDYGGILGFAEAAKYLQKIGLESIEKHVISLNSIITEGLNDPRISIIGPKDPIKRSGIFSFTIKGMDPHSAAMILDNSSNIMIRSGAHCVHSWFNSRNIKGSARASLYLYNTEEEAASFVEAIKNNVLGVI